MKDELREKLEDILGTIFELLTDPYIVAGFMFGVIVTLLMKIVDKLGQ